MLNPQFPYNGNQVWINSGRVLLHAKDDAVFIFASKGVGISTPATFNIDAPEQTIINSNRIDLGLRATHPVPKGDYLAEQLGRFFDEFNALAELVNEVAKKSKLTEFTNLSIQLTQLNNTAKDVKDKINTIVKSTTTYTV